MDFAAAATLRLALLPAEDMRVPHIGSSLIAWLTADFEIFGLTGQNWILALSGGLSAIFLLLALFTTDRNGRSGRTW